MPKFNVQQDMENFEMTHRVDGDKAVIRLSWDVHTRIEPLPDRYQGPCVEVLGLDPFIAAIHGERKP